MKCEYNDCFSCPYPDCIVDDRQLSKKLSAEKRRQSNNSARARYYQKNKDRLKAYQREYYHSHKKGETA